MYHIQRQSQDKRITTLTGGCKCLKTHALTDSQDSNPHVIQLMMQHTQIAA